MKVIYGGRQSGRTTELIKRASKIDGIIVCNSNIMANYIKIMAEDLRVKINNPITYENKKVFTIKKDGNKKKPLLFDEFDFFLLGLNIDTIVIHRGKDCGQEPPINKIEFF